MTGHPCGCGEQHRADVGLDEVRVLLVDDHAWVRTMLAELISGEDDLTVVGECEDGAQGVEAAVRLRPDVVVMDLSMPVMDGLAATEALRTAQPDQRIVMLTGDGAGARPKAAAAGADALVPKGTRPAALLHCLRTVVSGCGSCSYCF